MSPDPHLLKCGLVWEWDLIYIKWFYMLQLEFQQGDMNFIKTKHKHRLGDAVQRIINCYTTEVQCLPSNILRFVIWWGLRRDLHHCDWCFGVELGNVVNYVKLQELSSTDCLKVENFSKLNSWHNIQSNYHILFTGGRTWHYTVYPPHQNGRS